MKKTFEISWDEKEFRKYMNCAMADYLKLVVSPLVPSVSVKELDTPWCKIKDYDFMPDDKIMIFSAKKAYLFDLKTGESKETEVGFKPQDKQEVEVPEEFSNNIIENSPSTELSVLMIKINQILHYLRQK